MKSLIYILLFMFTTNVWSQNAPYKLDIRINDSIVVIKQEQETFCLNISLLKEGERYTEIFLFRFYKYIESSIFVFNDESLHNRIGGPEGLIFIVENENGIIPLREKGFAHISGVTIEDEERFYSKHLYAINKKKNRILYEPATDDQYSLYYNSYMIFPENYERLNLEVFPLLGLYKPLEKGEYYLSLFYTNPKLYKQIVPDQSGCYYYEYIQSNKVKLIIR